MSITIRGRIDEWTSNNVKWQLSDWEQDEDIEVCISSVGGSVFAAMEIYNLIANSGKNSVAIIEGFCLSSATLVVMACKTVKMYETGFFMIHCPTLVSGGNSENLQKDFEFLTKIEEQVIAIYAKRTKLATEEIKTMMDKETWLSAEEAKALGFIDEIIAVPEMAHYAKEVVMAWDESKRLEMCVTHNRNINMADNNKSPIGGGSNTPQWSEAHKDALMLADKILKSNDERASVEMIQKIIDEKKAGDEKILQLERTVMTMYKQQLGDLIQGAVDDGRITEMEAKTYREIGNYEQVKALLSVKKPQMRVSQVIHRMATGVAERDNWGYMDWSQKDPDGLLKMEDTDPERYQKLLADYKAESKR
jgi:ATP-dependent protease ClpP protease subunit